MSGYTEVFAWGGDHFGQLGLASKQTGKTYCVPRFCSFNIFIRQIACGEEHSAFIASNGCVYTMGSNSEGRLGIGSRAIRQSASPCLVEALTAHPADYISCGWGHTAVVCNGDVFTWGVGEYGALGLGTTESQWFPAQVGLPSDVTALSVSCGSRHTAVIASDALSHYRILLMTGAGEAGQLGTGRREKELSPVRIVFSEEIKQVSCGVFHTGFVTTAGRLFMMGGNSFGQLGLGTKKSSSVPVRVSSLDGVPVVKVACGHHSGAVSEYGELYIWGTGAFGEYLTPQAVTSLNARVTDIGIGGSFGAAIDTQGALWTWGSNTNGELGLGDYDPRLSPSLVVTLQGKKVKLVACGGAYCLAIGQDVSGSSALSSGRTHVKKALSHGVVPIPKESISPYRTRTPDDPSDKEPLKSPAYPPIGKSIFTRSKDPGIESSSRRFEDAQTRVLLEGDRVRRLEAELIEERRKNDLSVGELSRTLVSKDAVSRKLEIDNTKLTQDYNDLETALAAKDRELMTLRTMNDRLLREKSNFDGKIGSESSETAALRRRLEDLSADFEELLSKNRAKEQELTALQSLHDRVVLDRDRLEDLVHDKETALSLSRNATEKSVFSRKETDDLVRRKDNEISSLRIENRALETALSNKERETAADRYKIELFSGEKTKLETDLNGLNGEITRLVASEEALRAQNAELRQEIDARGAECGSLARDLDSFRREKNDLKAQLGDLRVENEDLKRKTGDIAGLLDAKNSEIAGLRRDLESASQARTLLSGDISQVLSEREALKQQNVDLRTRLSDKESDLNVTRQSFETGMRERNALQMQMARLEADLDTVSAAKEKLSVGLDQQLKATAQVKVNLEESCKRLEGELRRKEEEHYSAYTKLKEGLETKIIGLMQQLQEQRDIASDLQASNSGLETAKRNLSDLLNSETGKSEGLQRDSEQLRRIIESKEDQLIRAGKDLEDGQMREKELIRGREEVQKELERLRSQATKTQGDLQELETELEGRDKDKADLTQENNQLRASVEELKYEFERLYQQHSDSLREMGNLQDMNEELHEQYKSSVHECSDLRKQLADLETKNKEIFRNFEKELTNRAREFRERSLTALGTPSPIRSGAQITTSPIRPKPSVQSSAAKSTVATLSSVSKPKGESPDKRIDRNIGKTDFHEKVSKAAERLLESSRDPSPIASLRVSSPMRKRAEISSPQRDSTVLINSPPHELHSFRDSFPKLSDEDDPETLPQFAGNISKTTKTSVNDIRARLNALQSSKMELESKVEDLQRRIQEEPQITLGSEELPED